MTYVSQITTADDLIRIPDDGLRYELVQGELRSMPPAGFQHGRLVMNIATHLDQHVRANQLGVVCAAETGFRLATNPDTVRAADVAFVCAERVVRCDDIEGYWPGAPDLAIEVISPHDLYTEVESKVADWLDAATRMVVIVNLRRHTVTLYRSPTTSILLREPDTLDGGDVVPGWHLAVGSIFA